MSVKNCDIPLYGMAGKVCTTGPREKCVYTWPGKSVYISRCVSRDSDVTAWKPINSFAANSAILQRSCYNAIMSCTFNLSINVFEVKNILFG